MAMSKLPQTNILYAEHTEGFFWFCVFRCRFLKYVCVCVCVWGGGYGPIHPCLITCIMLYSFLTL